jgi:hypothetical protein
MDGHAIRMLVYQRVLSGRCPTIAGERLMRELPDLRLPFSLTAADRPVRRAGQGRSTLPDVERKQHDCLSPSADGGCPREGAAVVRCDGDIGGAGGSTDGRHEDQDRDLHDGTARSTRQSICSSANSTPIPGAENRPGTSCSAALRRKARTNSAGNTRPPSSSARGGAGMRSRTSRGNGISSPASANSSPSRRSPSPPTPRCPSRPGAKSSSCRRPMPLRRPGATVRRCSEEESDEELR